MEQLFALRIRNFPGSAKALALGYCMALGLAYMYALGNIALVVGLTPEKIAIHYYGAANVSTEKKSAGEEVLDLNQVGQEAPVMRPSFKNLVAEGHFHLFGMTSFFFGLSVLGLFTSVKEKWKIPMVGMPFFAVVIDNLSFLATRFMGPKFAYLTAISGGLMGLSFTILWLAIVWEILMKGNKT